MKPDYMKYDGRNEEPPYQTESDEVSASNLTIFLETNMSLKLYKVTCKGMTTSSTGVTHGISYVLAGDPTEAYETVRTNLDKHDLGFDKDRELDRIELIAENVDYPDCGTRVYV